MPDERRVYLTRWTAIDKSALATAIEWCGHWAHIRPGARVLVKPNLTFPFHTPGVTTPPDMIRAVTEVLLDHGAQVTLCEGGPSLDVYSGENAFREHGILALQAEYGVRVADLHAYPVVRRNFGRKPAGQNIPITQLIEECDVFVTLPMVKVHSMTTVTLALKNQWGLIPAKKRFLFHSALPDILAGLNAMLPHPLVIADARTVLDENGPMFGVPKPGNFLAVANDPGAFDFAVATLMGFNPHRIAHLRAGMGNGVTPTALSQITLNADLLAFRPFRFQLKRTLQNHVALAGFNYRWIGKLGYDSALSGVMHRLLYAIRGNPLKHAMQSRYGDRYVEEGFREPV